jgi:hypothetical protein
MDWFGMVNKMMIRVFGWRAVKKFAPITKINYYIDRKIPINRATLFLSGTIVTIIKKN